MKSAKGVMFGMVHDWYVFDVEPDKLLVGIDKETAQWKVVQSGEFYKRFIEVVDGEHLDVNAIKWFQ